jgi:hypothetical protein
MGGISLEGYPRSGNTFLFGVVSSAFPNINIKGFTHSVKNITSKTFVVVREPQMAISSFMHTFNEENKTSSENWWIRFYETALGKIDPSRWIYFEELINNPQSTVEKISNLCQIKHKKIEFTSINKNESFNKYPLVQLDRSISLYQEIKKQSSQE